MAFIFDGDVTNVLTLSPTDRGLQYGDGVFETMILMEGKTNHMAMFYHHDRLLNGLNLLAITYPDKLPKAADDLSDYLKDAARLLCPNIPVVRLRLTVWRKSGGLYTPTDNASHFLITAQPYQPSPLVAANTGICTTVKIPIQALSTCKTISALPYVLAAQERQRNGWDEILIKNENSYLAEAGSSNLFLITPNGDIVASPIDNGSIKGVMQGLVVEWLKRNGHSVLQYEICDFQLNLYSGAFVTSVAGIKTLQTINGHTYKGDEAEKLAQLMRPFVCPYQLG